MGNLKVNSKTSQLEFKRKHNNLVDDFTNAISDINDSLENATKRYEITYFTEISNEIMEKLEIGDIVYMEFETCGIVHYVDEEYKTILVVSKGYITYYDYYKDSSDESAEWEFDESGSYNYDKYLKIYTISIDGYDAWHTNHVQNGISAYSLVFDVFAYEDINITTLTFVKLKALISNSSIVANNTKADGFVRVKIDNQSGTILVGYDGDELNAQDFDAIKNVQDIDINPRIVF